MKNFLKSLLKSLAIGTVWVFILSIPIRGQLLFDFAHETLVQSSLIGLLDEKMNGAWEELKIMARSALADKDTDPSVQSF